MCQKRADVDVSVCLIGQSGLRVVRHSNDPVSIPSNVEDHVTIYTIGGVDALPDLGETVPSYRIHQGRPGLQFAGGILILGYCFL